jgi:hypothetical protein
MRLGTTSLAFPTMLQSGTTNHHGSMIMRLSEMSFERIAQWSEMDPIMAAVMLAPPMTISTPRCVTPSRVSTEFRYQH